MNKEWNPIAASHPSLSLFFFQLVSHDSKYGRGGIDTSTRTDIDKGDFVSVTRRP